MESDVSILQLKSSTCTIPWNDGRVWLIVIIIIITTVIKYLLTFSNPLLCAKTFSHFILPQKWCKDYYYPRYPNGETETWRGKQLTEVTQIISASIKNLTQVSHSDPRDTLSKQKGVYNNRVGWGGKRGRRMKGEGFCLFHSCLELCWHSCDYVERNKCIYMEIPKMDCIYHYFFPMVRAIKQNSQYKLWWAIAICLSGRLT